MKKGFSLIELLISLMIISLVAAAFVPIITKKLKYQNTTMGSNVQANCAKIDERCLLCTGKVCKLCSTQVGVSDGYYVDPNINCDIKTCPTGCQKCTFEGCLSCKGGYGYDGKNKTCSKCEIATYSAGGVDVCKACASNFVAQAGASSCVECKASEHKIVNEDKSACKNITCNIGQYIENITCKNCPPGTYQTATNHQNTSCINCPSNCSACTSGTNCTSCDSGYKLFNGTCRKITDAPCLRVGNICIAKFNAGDANGLPLVGSITIRTTVADYWHSGGVHSMKYCWRGATSTDCNASNGGYSACNRTVCTWSAAYDICYEHGWRLPTTSELSTFYNYTVNWGANGLQLCSPQGKGVAKCSNTMNCPGSYTGDCYPYGHWSSTKGQMYRCNPTWAFVQPAESYGGSVRCVRDL